MVLGQLQVPLLANVGSPNMGSMHSVIYAVWI